MTYDRPKPKCYYLMPNCPDCLAKGITQLMRPDGKPRINRAGDHVQRWKCPVCWRTTIKQDNKEEVKK